MPRVALRPSAPRRRTSASSTARLFVASLRRPQSVARHALLFHLISRGGLRPAPRPSCAPCLVQEAMSAASTTTSDASRVRACSPAYRRVPLHHCRAVLGLPVDFRARRILIDPRPGIGTAVTSSIELARALGRGLRLPRARRVAVSATSIVDERHRARRMFRFSVVPHRRPPRHRDRVPAGWSRRTPTARCSSHGSTRRKGKVPRRPWCTVREFLSRETHGLHS